MIEILFEFKNPCFPFLSDYITSHITLVYTNFQFTVIYPQQSIKLNDLLTETTSRLIEFFLLPL